MATMTPANICSGFRKCGIYPFNPDATDCTISTDNPAGHVQGGAGDEIDEDEGGECSHSAEDSGSLITFSAEKEQLFQVRYEEGYDHYDEEYLQWLNIHHPNAIPQDPEAQEAPPDLLDFGSADDLQLLANNSSLENCLMHLDRMLGIEGEDGDGEETDFQMGLQNSFDATSARILGDTTESSESLQTTDCTRPPSTQSSAEYSLPPGSTTPPCTPGSGSLTSPGSAAPPCTPGSGGSLTSPGSHAPPHTPGSGGSLTSPGSGTPGSLNQTPGTGELKYISKYLVQYVAATPKAKPAASAQRVSGARVLTSAQCVAILKEREEQKKKEQEEKEKRKIEREQKKQEREIAMKKRAEERERKAAEKAKKAEELAKREK